MERFFDAALALAHQAAAELHDPMMRAHAAGIPLETGSEFRTAQDCLMYAVIRGLGQTINQHPTAKRMLREAKNECGVQLDPIEVQQSVKDLFRDIQQSLSDDK